MKTVLKKKKKKKKLIWKSEIEDQNCLGLDERFCLNENKGYAQNSFIFYYFFMFHNLIPDIFLSLSPSCNYSSAIIKLNQKLA